jgi:K+-sensing histidine kinase KdpD
MAFAVRLPRLKWHERFSALRTLIVGGSRPMSTSLLVEKGLDLLRGVVLVVGIVALATVLTAAVDYFVGDTTIYTFYMAAVVAIGFRYGLGFLLLGGILSGLTYAYSFADPPDSFDIERPEVTFGLILFTALAVMTGQAARYWRTTHNNLRDARDGLLHRTEELSRSLERELESITVHRNFIATMCHEFRTPLTTIDVIAQSQMRAATARGDEKSADTMGILRSEVVRIGQLLASLERSLSGSSQSGARQQSVVVDEVVREACELQRLTTPSRTISMSGTWPAARLVGDRELLRQLFSNLLINAAKYSAPDTPIIIDGQKQNGFFEIAVIDQGIGIPPAERERVFEQYYRASNTGAVEGTGLGLTLCREVARSHGANIYITDNQPIGTRVAVRFPFGDGD